MVWLGIIGLPFVLFFAWAFELTPEGIKREEEVDRSKSITHRTGHRLNYIVIGLLVVAVVFRCGLGVGTILNTCSDYNKYSFG